MCHTRFPSVFLIVHLCVRVCEHVCVPVCASAHVCSCVYVHSRVHVSIGINMLCVAQELESETALRLSSLSTVVFRDHTQDGRCTEQAPSQSEPSPCLALSVSD